MLVLLSLSRDGLFLEGGIGPTCQSMHEERFFSLTRSKEQAFFFSPPRGNSFSFVVLLLLPTANESGANATTWKLFFG